MANKHNSLSFALWLCKYHFVFTPKYRRKIEFNQYKSSIVDIIKRLCKYKGVEIIEGERLKNRDFVEIDFVESPPHSLLDYEKALKKRIS